MMFSNELMERKMTFTACGFFKLDFDLLQSVSFPLKLPQFEIIFFPNQFFNYFSDIWFINNIFSHTFSIFKRELGK